MKEFVVNNVTIVPDKNAAHMIKQGYVVVKNGKIHDVKSGDYDRKNGEYEVINGKGKWLLPGLFNTHTHTPMGLLRGASDDLPLHEWLNDAIWPLEKRLDRDMVSAGSALSIVEMIRTGTIGFLDMYHLHMDEVGKLVEQAGIKAVLSRGMIGFGSEEEQANKVKEALTLAQHWEEIADGRIKSMLFPHAPYTCPPDFIKRVTEAAEHHHLPVGIHLAETKKEVLDYEKQFGCSPVHMLDEMGFFDNEAVAAHVVHVSEDDLERIRTKDVHVSHNPVSNLKLGSGIAPIPKMLEMGISVSLGTDSVASNNDLDLFQEMRTAALIHKGVAQDPSVVDAASAFHMATSAGAKALGFQQSGEITIGNDADFILLDPQVANLHPKDQVSSHIVYAASGKDVTDMYVNGEEIMQNRVLQTLDEEKILFEAEQQHKRLVEWK